VPFGFAGWPVKGEMPTPEQLATLDSVIRQVARAGRLQPHDADDFSQSVHVRLIERQYDVFDRFDGRSSLRTYLTVVVRRLLLDSLILVLGFGTFFWFFVISPAAAASEEEFARFVLTQVYIGLDCLMLMAIGVLLMNATSCPMRAVASSDASRGSREFGDVRCATIR